MAAQKRPARRATTREVTEEIIDRAEKGTRKRSNGLQDGDERFTCVLRKADNQLLHDWAATVPGLTFRDIIVTACAEYIDGHVRPAAEDGLKVIRPKKYDAERMEITLSEYGDLYEEEGQESAYQKYL